MLSPLTCGSPTMMESWSPGRTGTPPPGLPPPPSGGSNNNGGATSVMTPSIIPQPGITAPIASPEGVSDVSKKSASSNNCNEQFAMRTRDLTFQHRDKLTGDN